MGDRIETGGAAFPVSDHPENIIHPGMTLRDWFAGQALAGLSANREWKGGVSWKVDCVREALTEEAYLTADAMLAARTGGDNG